MSEISVIMPVYNGAGYIRTAAESVLAQTFCDFELIVVDDGSTDGTADVVCGMARADGRIRYLRQDNKGVSAARNHGMGNSKGKYISFLDCDDSYYPEFLAKTRDAIIQENADYCACWSEIDMGDKGIDYYRPVRTRNEIVDFIRFKSKLRINGILADRDFLFANGIFFYEELSKGEDHNFLNKVVSIGRSCYVHEILCKYNFVENSLSKRGTYDFARLAEYKGVMPEFLEWAELRKDRLKTDFEAIKRAADSSFGKFGVKNYWRHILHEKSMSPEAAAYYRNRYEKLRFDFTRSGALAIALRLLIPLPMAIKKKLAAVFHKAGII
ncbi:MAG: glycosyltransferase family 2 protein [Clostridia bacterium]|nr:glycosyltransferase family 2 protein [Clostridia bacterium]